MTPQQISSFFPGKLTEICGNIEVLERFLLYIQNGLLPFLLTGPFRSGKTRLITWLIQVLLCREGSSLLAPCGVCDACGIMLYAKKQYTHIFRAVGGSRYGFLKVDGMNVTQPELRYLAEEANDDPGTIVWVDEFDHLIERGMADSLLKYIDEGPSIWIASSVNVMKSGAKGKLKGSSISTPLAARFPDKLVTSMPNSTQLKAWIIQRCADWDISIEDPKIVLPQLVKLSGFRPGIVLHYLASAAVNNRKLTMDLIRKHRQMP